MNALTYKRSLLQVDPKISDPPLVLPSVSNVYDVGLDAKGEWDFLDTLPSDETDVRSSLRGYFSVFHGKYVEFSVETLRRAANVFKLALQGINTLGEHQELFGGRGLAAQYHLVVGSQRYR